MNLQPIGFVKSPITAGVDENWGQVISEIHLNENLVEGLQGLDQFSHVIVIFWMHQTTFNPHELARRPRGRDDMPLLGVFAQRAKHRPNPIGLTPVELLQVEKNVLTVKGLDAIDGTPVLDLKPYFPIFDQILNARTPAWVERLMQGYF